MLIRLHPRTAPELALGDVLVLRRADPDDPAQVWRFDSTGRLAPVGSVLAVTAVAGSVDPGLAPLSRTDPAQRWSLGCDLVRHPATGLVLRPEHSVPVAGSRVLLGTPTGTDTQCWLPRPGAAHRAGDLVTNYDNVQLVAYGTATSRPVQVLPDNPPSSAGPPDAAAYDADMKMRGATPCKVADWILTDHGAAVADPATLKVLVIPEFYFRFGGPVSPSAPPETLNNSYPYPNAPASIQNLIGDVLLPHFGTDPWQDWLIVAGTVFWHVPADQTLNGAPAYLNTLIVINGGRHVDRPDTGDPVPTMDQLSTNQKRLMSRIDWSIRVGEDRSAWDARLNPMFAQILDDAQYLRWHRFMADGKNNGSGQPVVFGVEVCLEHSRYGAAPAPQLGVLRMLRQLEPALPAPTVQIVTSCGMALNKAIGLATDRGGVNMICDGMEVVPAAAFTWPTADVTVTENIVTDGTRTTTVSTPLLGTWDLPAGLQVGAGTSPPRTPADRVSISDPVPLA